MEERTRLYLRGRFRDHYRRTTIAPPTDARDREWGYIPWTEGPGTTMVRHRSTLDLGDIGDFLVRERPRHVYFSAGRYDDPDTRSMAEKGWHGSDLVFDLDADHLPGVAPDEDTYAEMLAACKDALFRLLDFLDGDFGFSELTIVFSGSRGYHVHVRDPGIQRLERDQRREIVDYVRGIGLDFESLVTTESVAGLGRKTPADKRTLDTRGGWSRRVHRHVVAFVDELLDLDEEDALERLREFEGIGAGKARAALAAARENREEIEGGNVDVHPAFYGLVQSIMAETVDRDDAPIDEPVTTDTHRLIRLPDSLHGGSGFVAMHLDRDELDAFDPLVDAVPETFTGHDIAVEVTDGGLVEVGGDARTLTEGETRLPEHVGVFMMARGRAEKAKE